MIVLRIPFLFLLPLLVILRSSHASQAAGTETLIGIVGKDFILLGADSSVSQSISLTSSNLDKIAPLSEPFFYDKEKHRNNENKQQCIVAAAAGDAASSDRLVGQLKAHATLAEYESGLGCDVEYKGGRIPMIESGIDVETMAYFARSQIASALRSRTPFQVCLLIAGMMSSTLDDGDDNDSQDESSFVAKRVQQQVQKAWMEPSSSSSTSSSSTSRRSSAPTATDIKNESKSQMETKLKPRLFWLDEYGSLQSIQYGAHGYGSNFCLSILDQGYKPQMTLEEAHKLLKECFQELRTRYVINSPQPPCIKCVDANGIRLIR